jgi:hypothetical protein
MRALQVRRGASAEWFNRFLAVPDLPETFIAGREEAWLTHFYRSGSYDPNMLSPEEIDLYVRTYRQPGAIRGADRLSRRRRGRETGSGGWGA